ncbi:MAG: carbohydrate kinase family protein [Nocardiopsaceae bacterium]|nr:carbohydrate kinase family protein [Nocardiopsaceae bacterium]
MPHQLTTAPELGVIGNISRDLAVYPSGRSVGLLGGAALHVSLAAARRGLSAAPVAVIGTDLAWITGDARLSGLNMSTVKVVPGESAVFRLTYDDADRVTGTGASFGAAEALTGHALSALGARSYHSWHVCCRRPLSAPLILSRLAETGAPFSADFHVASATEIVPSVATTLPRASAVFVNAEEYTVLSRSTDPGGLPLVVVSDGPRVAVVLRYGQVTARATPPSVAVAEVTGAGDALAGTFLAAAARGASDDDALRTAVAAAAAAVAGPGLALCPEGR